MNFISLNAWALREGISCATSQKLYKEGKLTGAYEEPAGKLKRIKVPEGFHMPKTGNEVTCHICGKEFPQITHTHLKSHGITPDEYKREYPDAVLVGADVVETIRSKITGIQRSEEFKENVSKGRSGITPKNHSRYEIGSYSPTEETRRKMAEAHTGLTHTEESKAKIGNAHRGKIIPDHVREFNSERMTEFHKHNDSYFKGKTHSEETKNIVRENTRRWMNSMTPEQKAAYAAKMSKAITGIKRTPEQRERYSAARSKYMSENPSLFVNTKGEREIAAWLTERSIAFVQQYQIPGHNHPYDFYLPEQHTIIEFDGAHHWIGPWWLPTDAPQELREGILADQQEKDDMETLIAVDAGYKIIRVRGRNGVDSEHGSINEQIGGDYGKR